MKQEKNSILETKNSYIEDFNKNNEKDIISIIGEYGEYTEDFYRQKFPGFDDWVHKILADCSKKKLEDHRKKNILTFEERDTTLSFD